MRITAAAPKEVAKAFAAYSPAIVVGKAKLWQHYSTLCDQRRKMCHSVPLFGGIQRSFRGKSWYVCGVHFTSPLSGDRLRPPQEFAKTAFVALAYSVPTTYKQARRSTG
jgi:hypothetical protein